MPSHFFVLCRYCKGKSPDLYLAERRFAIWGNLRLKSNERNEGTLFDQKSMIQRQKPRNNASTFRILLISVFFAQITHRRSSSSLILEGLDQIADRRSPQQILNSGYCNIIEIIYESKLIQQNYLSLRQRL